jgi:hypothetical protein
MQRGVERDSEVLLSYQRTWRVGEGVTGGHRGRNSAH